MKINYGWYIRDKNTGNLVCADDYISYINEDRYVKCTYPRFKYESFLTEEDAVKALNEYLNYKYHEPYEGTYVLLKEFGQPTN